MSLNKLQIKEIHLKHMKLILGFHGDLLLQATATKSMIKIIMIKLDSTQSWTKLENFWIIKHLSFC
jgi:hypothetical protein